jgi:flagellar biosynthesis GTPase FlhF
MTRILILFIFLSGSNPNEIARINAFKKEAEKSFLSGDYADAISRYTYLIDSMQVEEDEIILNLAHAYHQISDSANARTYYSKASMSPNMSLKSIAYQQLGVISKNPETLKESLQYLKASVKANPANMDARYDYELVKKQIKEQEQKQENKENKDEENKEENKEDQENQDQENQENKDGEEDKKEQENQEQDKESQDQEDKEGEEDQQEQEAENEKEGEDENQQEQSTKEKLKEMNISEEKAQMILEAMRNSEIQYIQQQKRKATKKPESGKPDW